jgi:hypothetical protein
VPSREIVALHRASMSDSPAIAALLAALARGDGEPADSGAGDVKMAAVAPTS